MSKSPPITITSEELRNRAEENLGARIPGDLWDQAEKLARHKLDLYRQRQPGTTYYDNEYLVLLTADTGHVKGDHHARKTRTTAPAEVAGPSPA